MKELIMTKLNILIYEISILKILDEAGSNNSREAVHNNAY
jgi:hypothetical protein